MAKFSDDYIPVTGGVDLSDDQIRDLGYLQDLVVASDLDKHIARLLALHPQLRIRFRNQDLAALSDDTKTALLKDINHVLGIRPLRRSAK